MEELSKKKCVPCEGGAGKLDAGQINKYIHEVDKWMMVDDKRIEKTIHFKNFASALAFINKVGAIAEQENHHPDFCLTGWNKVRFTLSTHAVGGLSENDFILAAKIDELARE